MVVRVTLDEPLAQRHELHGLLVLIEGQALARDGVVLGFALCVATRLQLVRVVFIFADEVSEHRFFFASGVQQQFDVFVELTPLLGLLRLVLVLFSEVVDHDWGFGLCLRLATGG